MVGGGLSGSGKKAESLKEPRGGDLQLGVIEVLIDFYSSPAYCLHDSTFDEGVASLHLYTLVSFH